MGFPRRLQEAFIRNCIISRQTQLVTMLVALVSWSHHKINIDPTVLQSVLSVPTTAASQAGSDAVESVCARPAVFTLCPLAGFEHGHSLN